MMRLLQTAEAVTEAENLGERFGNAGLNTLMGMGIVFLVLILISLIISAFGIIHKMEEKKAGKKRKAVPEADARVRGLGTKPALPYETAEPALLEEVTDEQELIAVIAAAIAAYGGTDPSGFTVRSIRRIQNNTRRR